MSARLGQLAIDAGDAAGPARPSEATEAGSGDALTARESDVLRLLARGQTNLEIARALVVREGTVKYHVKNILRKLGATSRADAVARYARSGARALP
jgi:DNA-binding NarL/FixJ family response regulator